MKIVIALGGNAISHQGDPPGPEAQRRRVAEAVSSLADIVRGHDVAITHGNGPQVGLLAMQAARREPGSGSYPLDVLGAETEGQLGYLLETELAAVFPSSEVATLLTQVVVDADDPAFLQPEKPIGLAIEPSEAAELSKRLGWTFMREAAGARRVVPSPEPRRIREIRTIARLLDAGVLVVCAGGGGIPVIEASGGAPIGVEAVVDKDLTSALLARELEADWLLLLTDVPGVYEDWPARDRMLEQVRVDELRAMGLAPGSMGPKAEAACRVVEGGGKAAIGRLSDARRVLAGLAGTRVVPGSSG